MAHIVPMAHCAVNTFELPICTMPTTGSQGVLNDLSAAANAASFDHSLRGMRVVRASIGRQSPGDWCCWLAWGGPTGEDDVMGSERPFQMNEPNLGR